MCRGNGTACETVKSTFDQQTGYGRELTSISVLANALLCTLEWLKAISYPTEQTNLTRFTWIAMN